MATQDELVLANDVAGYHYVDRFVNFGFASESSAHGASTTLTELWTVPAGFSGEILEVGLGTVLQALSASGFVSGTVDCTVRINSVAVCSTNPSIAMAGSAAQTSGRTNTFGGGITALAVSGVVNVASNAFVPGDQIAVDLNARSVGSAAAGAAGKGLYGYVRFRYKAR